MNNGTLHPTRATGSTEDMTITRISKRDVSLRILTEANGSKETSLKRIEGILALVEQLIADMEGLRKGLSGG
jgi:hypothetical protein